MPRRTATGVRIGTAGWSVPRAVAAEFDVEGSHLARYATRLNAAEIDTSFYRSHGVNTYARWAATVPADFRFAVKLPRSITHDRRLAADPARVADAAEPGGDRALVYFRLHGSPETYRTAYGAARLEPIATALLRARADGADAWCIFDNTMLGAAAADALCLQRMLGATPGSRTRRRRGRVSPSA